MNGLQFAASIAGTLVWPLLVLVALVLFRRPLGKLIGRVTSYEGLGQKLTFGDALADAENSVIEAVQQDEVAGQSVPQLTAGPSPLVQEAEANPSYTVVVAWEQLTAALADLFGAALPGQVRPRSQVQVLQTLERREVIPPAFVKAVQELRALRNQVAHGGHNPTAGEAIAYANSAMALANYARAEASHIMSENSDADAQASDPPA